tara:strand:- start:864 stop:1043 length:180 start_codon:yes stop_codon:yes gene_type:complete
MGNKCSTQCINNTNKFIIDSFNNEELMIIILDILEYLAKQTDNEIDDLVIEFIRKKLNK